MLTDCLNCKAMVRLHWWGEACGACGDVRVNPLGKVAGWCRVFLLDSDYGNRRGILSSLRDLPSGIDRAVRTWYRAYESQVDLDLLNREIRAYEKTIEALWNRIFELGAQNKRFAMKAIEHDNLQVERDHWFKEAARYRDMLHNAHNEVTRLERKGIDIDAAVVGIVDEIQARQGFDYVWAAADEDRRSEFRQSLRAIIEEARHG